MKHLSTAMTFTLGCVLAAGSLFAQADAPKGPPPSLEPVQTVDSVVVPKERLADVAYWEDATAAEPEDVTLRLALGNAYALNRRYPDAVREYRRLVATYPESKAAWNNMGSVYRAMGKPQNALDAFQKALKVDPRYGLAYYNIGTIYENEGYFDRAIKNYGLALRCDPKLMDSSTNPQVVANKLLFVAVLHNYVEGAGGLALPLEPAYPENPGH